MSGTRIVVDGLWRCLCPAFDNASLLRVINAPLPPLRRGGARPLSERRRPHVHGTPGRQVHTGAHARVGRLGLLSGSETASPEAYKNGSPDGEPDSSWADQLPWVRSLLAARKPYRRELEAAPTPAIYAALRQLQYAPAAFHRIQIFVRFLLHERHEAPTAALYEALVRANCHTTGSADAVRDVLRALKEAGIEGTPGIYHGALSVRSLSLSLSSYLGLIPRLVAGSCSCDRSPL